MWQCVVRNPQNPFWIQADAPQSTDRGWILHESHVIDQLCQAGSSTMNLHSDQLLTVFCCFVWKLTNLRFSVGGILHYLREDNGCAWTNYNCTLQQLPRIICLKTDGVLFLKEMAIIQRRRYTDCVTWSIVPPFNTTLQTCTSTYFSLILRRSALILLQQTNNSLQGKEVLCPSQPLFHIETT